MTREQAIERAARDACDSGISRIDGQTYFLVLSEDIQNIRKALAMPKDAEPVAVVFDSINSSVCYIETINNAQLPFGTKLYTHPPKPDPRRDELPTSSDYEDGYIAGFKQALEHTPECKQRKDELVRRIEESTSHYQPDESITDLLKDIRDYLEGL
jgi:hypothetical protein